ncbi:acyltransferase family protein [Pseudomonas sp. DWRC2-2]|uniref:acyltransferase family protein n=1 Tax=Pseudomonas sp. DWRC2-2 TaxID=2804567 RepID=UPI003CF7B287
MSLIGTRDAAGFVAEEGRSEAKLKFRGDVQGLRAIAVLAVMIFHAQSSWLPAGFIGVDIFFVISGFLISSIIIEREKDFSWSGFYWNRIKRIVPVYIVMLAVVSCVSSIFFVLSDFSYFKKSLFSAFFFVSNQYFSNFGSYFAPGAHELPLLHTWLLAIEMQFYIFLPALILWTPRRWLGLLVGGMCVVFFMYAEWRLSLPDNSKHVYFSLVARVPEFLVGVFIAVAGIGNRWSSRVASLVSVAGLFLLGLCFMYTDEKHFPGLAAFLPCLATGMLIAAKGSIVSQIISSRGFVWLGTLSYSLYLWHWPVLAFMRYYLGHDELSGTWLLSFLVITYALSWMSYRWVEEPARRGRGMWGPALGGGIITVAALVYILSPRLNASVEATLPAEMTRYAPDVEICHGQIVGTCVRGDLAEPPTVLVLGDSHAAQLNEFFDVAVEKDKFSARVITGSSCVPIPGFDVERLPEFAEAACRSQISALAPYVDQARVIVVAAMWQWQVPSPAFMTAFSNFLEQTTKRNVRVIVLAQVPMFDVSLLRVRRFETLGLPSNVSEDKDWRQANAKVAAVVSQYKGAEFIDLSGSEFFSDAPFLQGQLIYMDNSHLNEIGARAYGMFAAPILKTLLAPPL